MSDYSDIATHFILIHFNIGKIYFKCKILITYCKGKHQF